MSVKQKNILYHHDKHIFYFNHNYVYDDIITDPQLIQYLFKKSVNDFIDIYFNYNNLINNIIPIKILKLLNKELQQQNPASFGYKEKK